MSGAADKSTLGHYFGNAHFIPTHFMHSKKNGHYTISEKRTFLSYILHTPFFLAEALHMNFSTLYKIF